MIHPLLVFFFLALFAARAAAAPSFITSTFGAPVPATPIIQVLDVAASTATAESIRIISSSNTADIEVNLDCQSCGKDNATASTTFRIEAKGANIPDCSAQLSIDALDLTLTSTNRRQTTDIDRSDLPDVSVVTSITCPGETVRAAPTTSLIVDILVSSGYHAQDTRIEITFAANGLVESIRSDTASAISQTESEAAEIKHQLYCAAKRTRHSIEGGVSGLLQRLGSTLGEDRMMGYSQRVQAAMSSDDDMYDCNEKLDDQDAQVSVTVAFVEIEQEAPQEVSLEDAPKGLIIALGVLAAALGVAGLLACLKRRCASLRYRVERLADREERTKAREYRRAARKESRRRFWLKLRTTFTSCFTGVEDSDEEKAGLVMNAAEEGRSDETLEEAEAHMKGLCYAHDLAAQLAATGHFGDIGLEIDKSNSQHMIQHRLQTILDRYVPQYCRSRSSSLPSYDSGILPDYSSQPDMDEVLKSAMVVDGFRPGMHRSNTGDSSRFTPVSSIPSISRRASMETLGTQGTQSSRCGM